MRERERACSVPGTGWWRGAPLQSSPGAQRSESRAAELRKSLSKEREGAHDELLAARQRVQFGDPEIGLVFQEMHVSTFAHKTFDNFSIRGTSKMGTMIFPLFRLRFFSSR